MNDQKTVVDYSYWLKTDLWTIKQAASLFSSIEPNSDESNSMIPVKVENMIRAGIIAETIIIDYVDPETNEAMFYPMNIIHWVKFQKGFKLPAPIDEWYEEEYRYQRIQEVNEELYESGINKVVICDDMNQTERRKMLTLIIGMAIDSYEYKIDGSRNNATGTNKNSISSRLETHGISITDDTIRKYLAEAKEFLPPKFKNKAKT
jgi:hypothetical protein